MRGYYLDTENGIAGQGMFGGMRGAGWGCSLTVWHVWHWHGKRQGYLTDQI